jgi:LEA14-like dessication related protein
MRPGALDWLEPNFKLTIYKASMQSATRFHRSPVPGLYAAGLYATSRRTMAILIVCAMGLAACAGVPPVNLKAPELKISSFDLTSISLSKIDFSLVVDASNPNAVDVPISDLNFDLNLLGTSFAKGQATDHIVLARGKTQPVTVDFSLSTSQFLKTLRQLKQAKLDDMKFSLNGSARWGKNGILLPFERQGSLDVLDQLRDLLQPFAREAQK